MKITIIIIIFNNLQNYVNHANYQLQYDNNVQIIDLKNKKVL